jgi:uncharacterized protein with von Willebrand factor type A (vWA) domain
VLLIDELDRTDEPFEAFLLEALSRFPGHDPRARHRQGAEPPIVILTSNRTREVHDALKRRCLYHWVDYPISSARWRSCGPRARGRRDAQPRGGGLRAALRTEDLFKKPGVAETIDWAKCLLALDVIDLSPEVIADTLGAILKYQDDIQELQLDMVLSWSATEKLRAMDFEQMSAAEAAEAARAIRTLRLPVPPLTTRRRHPATRGRTPDLRATLRQSLRKGGEIGRILRRAPRTRPPDLVALVDISGSMSAYARMMLHFLHALAATGSGNWGRVAAFTFGTRLTNISRALGRRDPDAALQAIGQAARDWDGGTRIGAALDRFNKDWSRRVLGQGAVVLLITDGLERGDTALLARAAERLHLTARRVIWLNPLLRWEGFAPEAAGIKALLPHTSQLIACHNLDSLAALARTLAQGGARA